MEINPQGGESFQAGECEEYFTSDGGGVPVVPFELGEGAPLGEGAGAGVAEK